MRIARTPEPDTVRHRGGLVVGHAAGLAGSVAGCSWGSFPDADVIAGLEGRDVFEPTELTVPVGETVTWGFASSGHNVSCRPDDSDEVRLPKDAEPFASYGRGEAPLVTHVPQGDTYEHTFDVTGEYVSRTSPGTWREGSTSSNTTRRSGDDSYRF